MVLSNEEQDRHFRTTVHNIFEALAIAKEANTPASADTLETLDVFLTWLNEQFESTSNLQKKYPVLECLLRLQGNFGQQIPAAYRDRAKMLHDVCMQEQGTSVEQDNNTDATELATSVLPASITAPPQTQTQPDPSARPARSAPTSSTATANARPVGDRYTDIPGHGRIRLPPLDHPIFGRGGIMFGLALKQNPSRTTPILDTVTPGAVRPFGQYGNNGHTVNAWFPSQMAALAQGAHGAGVRGISGDQELGAYSLVVSAGYDNDRVTENEILYSPTAGADRDRDTAILRASLRTRNPARVLLAASQGGRLAPSVGLQYIGLYVCVGTRRVQNAGQEDLVFVLRRRDGQAAIDTTIPGPAQRRDYERVKDGY